MDHPILGAVSKYPAPCGCAGPLYVSMCHQHQNEDIERSRRLMGIPSQLYTQGIEKDAARYRWLRDKFVTVFGPNETQLARGSTELLDTQVDEGMKNEPKRV